MLVKLDQSCNGSDKIALRENTSQTFISKRFTELSVRHLLTVSKAFVFNETVILVVKSKFSRPAVITSDLHQKNVLLDWRLFVCLFSFVVSLPDYQPASNHFITSGTWGEARENARGFATSDGGEKLRTQVVLRGAQNPLACRSRVTKWRPCSQTYWFAFGN